MNTQELEQEAQKLFGGAKIDVAPYSDGVMNAFDVTIIPVIGGEKRFIRVSSADGVPAVKEYLRKIQQNLLKLQSQGAFGIRPVQEQVDQSIVDKVVKERLGKPEEKDLEKFGEPIKSKILECDCGYKSKYPGIMGIHKKKCKTADISAIPIIPIIPVNRVMKAKNDLLIYDL